MLKNKIKNYLISEEYPFSRMIFCGLNPRIALEMNRATSKTFNGNSFQKEFLLVLIGNCDCTRRPKI